MTKHTTGTRKEWIAARLEVLAALAPSSPGRQEQLRFWIDKQYRFETGEGRASLAELFRGRWQFLFYHFILGIVRPTIMISGPMYKPATYVCAGIGLTARFLLARSSAP